MQISMVPYSTQDFQAINQLFLELQLHEHQFDPKKTTKAEMAEKYRVELLETIQEQSGEMLIAKDENKTIGLVAWYRESELEYDEPYGYISDIVVSKEYRGRGIGKQLLNQAIANIQKANLKRVIIGVLLANTETKSFYEKSGFRDYSVEMVKEL